VEELRSAVESKTRELLPDLIGLTDAFGYSDWELNSVLGGRDGQPYNQLLERAQGLADVNLGDQTYQADIQEILTAGRTALSHGQAKL
jgi:acyl-CoA oxidase